MRQVIGLMALGCLLAVPLQARAQSGGSFQIPWSSAGAGGGMAVGGGFSLNGLVASWDSGQSSGGTFSLQGGWGGPIATIGAPAALPTTFAWIPASPNPFASRTMLGFALPRAAHVQVAAFDLRGRRVRALVDESLAAGWHRLAWDGVDDGGAPLPSGIYFVKLDAGAIHATSRVVLVH